jgi:hypothetical protein
MPILRQTLVVITLLGAVEIRAQTYPPLPVFDGVYDLPERSGSFRPLRIQVSDAQWDGTSLLRIPFSINQRATVWLAVYQMDSERGETGPGSAWLHLTPQPKLVSISDGRDFQPGSNTITWEGRDWRGDAVSAGEFEFDVIAINNLDKAVLAGPSARTGFGRNIIDTRHDPPEIWVQEYDRPAEAWGRHKAGDVIRGFLGTDYLINPAGWERWDYNGNVFDFADARTTSGLRFDDVDEEVFWTTHWRGFRGGLYKMNIDRTRRSWTRDQAFSINGFAPNREDRIMDIAPWKEVVYAAHWSRGSVPYSTIELWDKNSGDVIHEYDVTEFFSVSFRDEEGRILLTSRGPSQLEVNERGIWADSWGTPHIVHLDHEGEILWVNRNGDTLGDNISNESAVELGMRRGARGNNLQMGADGSGRLVFVATYKNDRGSQFCAFGRDGSGLFDVHLRSTLGPFRNDTTWYLTVVDQDGGDFDGIYYGTHLNMMVLNFDFPQGRKFGPGMLLYIPYDLDSGRITPVATNVTAAVDARPNEFRLDPAYPNPFNGSTTIPFSLPTSQRVRLQIFDVVGRTVTTLLDRELEAGRYQVPWRPVDDHSRPAASGVYFAHISGAAGTATRALLHLK